MRYVILSFDWYVLFDCYVLSPRKERRGLSDARSSSRLFFLEPVWCLASPKVEKIFQV
jgi:hypothetical protein